MPFRNVTGFLLCVNLLGFFTYLYHQSSKHKLNLKLKVLQIPLQDT